MKVSSRDKAWEMVNKIFPTDYEKNEKCSANAGYAIYTSTSTSEEYRFAQIADLGNRLEVNDGISTINIWIEEDCETETAETLPSETIEKIGKRIANKMALANMARREKNHIAGNSRTNPFISELNGMLQLLNTMEIAFEIHYSGDVAEMVAIEILGKKFKV